jgi:hypothetical protein
MKLLVIIGWVPGCLIIVGSTACAQETKVPGGVTYEAEDATLSGGAKVNNDHLDYSGKGFVDGYWNAGATTMFTVMAPSAGTYKVSLRYSTAVSNEDQSLSIFVNQTKIREINFALTNTKSWDTWGYASEFLALKAGSNTIAYKYDAGDSGSINLDCIVVTPANDSTPAPVYEPLDDVRTLLSRCIKTSEQLQASISSSGTGAANFLMRGVSPNDFAILKDELARNPSPEVLWQIESATNRLREIIGDQKRRLRDYAALSAGDRLDFMQDHVAYLVADFQGEAPQKPVMGSELSDFGSWYDIAYSGGINRFRISSVRKHVEGNEFFNTAAEIGLLALFFKTPSGEIIDGSHGDSAVSWYPFGWKTTTRHGDIEIESAAFFTAFNTIAVLAKVKNMGAETVTVTPSLLVTDRSEYNGQTGGRVAGWAAPNNRLAWRNTRVGKSVNPKEFTDTLMIGSTLGELHSIFLPRYLASGRGSELQEALRANWKASLQANAGSAVVSSDEMKLGPGEAREFSFYVTAGADDKAAEKLGVSAEKSLSAAGPAEALARVEQDWNNYLGGLPKLNNPSYEDLQLYYSAAIALRKNRFVLEQNGKLYDASFPARGGFNYFYQSDSCWNSLGYLDINPAWAVGHAVPILVPPSQNMDPHFYWSMWEMYSRLPDSRQQRDFATMVYPLLKETYRVWTTQVDTDGNLLCSTPNNWDDNPRADLLFKELPDRPGWNSWWNDWARGSRENALNDPASSSQLGYGTVVLGRFARILGKNQEANDWAKQFQRHVQAINSLWDEESGYWIVTYRGTLKDRVLTSSILYPVFTDLCRDPARIRRVIETHILNPAEFNGRFPIPTVAYNDSRYYKQMPPHEDVAGGLWRGNIWLPEAWIIVKGLYKYGYEAEARDMARRLIDMMSHQAASTAQYPQFAYSPAEWYDSRNGLAQNNRAFSWTSAVALDFLLGNYENERMLGTNPERDRTINGHVREIFDFESGKSLFRVVTVTSVFPLLRMTAADNLPINRSSKVEFSFSDPGNNFAGSTVAFSVDQNHWSVVTKETGIPLKQGADGYYHAPFGGEFTLVRAND